MNRLALIGLGSIGRKHLVNLKKLYPSCEILVCSSSGKRYPEGDDYTVKNNIAEIISCKPDAVIIATPSPFHLEQIKAFQDTGIPVLVEKPLCADADSLSTTVISDQKLAVAYCLRYLPAARCLKAFLESKQPGTIYNINATVGQYLPDWRKDKNYKQSVSASKELGGGALLELSHELDMLNYLSGDLSFQFANLRTHQQLGLDVEEIADLMLLSQGNIVCHVHLDFIQKKPHRKITIIAEHGTIEWNIIENKVVFNTADNINVLFYEDGYDKNNMYLAMIKDFENMVYDKPNQCVSLKEAADIIVLIDKIKKLANWS